VAADLKSIYAFVVSDPSRVTNAQLLYENLALTIGVTKFTETEYLDQVVDMLLQQKDWFECQKSILDNEMNIGAYIFIWLPFPPSGCFALAPSVSRSTPR